MKATIKTNYLIFLCILGLFSSFFGFLAAPLLAISGNIFGGVAALVAAVAGGATMMLADRELIEMARLSAPPAKDIFLLQAEQEVEDYMESLSS